MAETDEIVPVTKDLTEDELRWIRQQERKAIRAAGSKYVRHQGKREMARRVRQMERSAR